MLNEVVTFEFNCNAKYAFTSVKCKLMSLVLSFLLLGGLFLLFWGLLRLTRRLRRNHIQCSGFGAMVHALLLSPNTTENEEE